MGKKGANQLRLMRDNVNNLEITGPSTEKRFVVRAPLELIDIVDELILFNGFASRNEFVIHAIKSETNKMLKRRRK